MVREGIKDGVEMEGSKVERVKRRIVRKTKTRQMEIVD